MTLETILYIMLTIFSIFVLFYLTYLALRDTSNNNYFYVEIFLFGEYREQGGQFPTYEKAEQYAKLVSEGQPYKIIEVKQP